MARNFTEARVLNMPIQFVINKLHFIGTSKLRMNVNSETPIQNGFQFKLSASLSMSSWGENVTVSLIALSPNSTQIHIYSECCLPTTLFDMGKNKQNVYEIFNYIVS